MPRRWRFEEPYCDEYTPHRPYGEDSMFWNFVQFKKWLEAEEKKIKEAAKSANTKKPFWGFSHRELVWWAFFLSPLGMFLSYAELLIIKKMMSSLGIL